MPYTIAHCALFNIEKKHYLSYCGFRKFQRTIWWGSLWNLFWSPAWCTWRHFSWRKADSVNSDRLCQSNLSPNSFHSWHQMATYFLNPLCTFIIDNNPGQLFTISWGRLCLSITVTQKNSLFNAEIQVIRKSSLTSFCREKKQEEELYRTLRLYSACS